MKRQLASLLILILLILSFSLPRQSQALFGVGDIVFDPTDLPSDVVTTAEQTSETAISWWEKTKSIREKILRQLAGRVLLKTTQRVINWGVSGFQGNPFYVQDQNSFFRSIADQQLANIVDESLKKTCRGNTTDCSPYARSTAKILIKGYAAGQSVGTSLKDAYNASNTIAADKCRKGTSTLGYWGCQNVLTNDPQNNALGAYFEASKELNERIENAISGQKEELLQNNGFLSLKKCVQKKPKNTRGETLNVTANTKTYSHTTLGGKNVMCVEDPKTQAELWKCAGTCTARDQELANTVRTQWEARKCYDKAPGTNTGTGVGDYGIGVGNIALNASLTAGGGNFQADDCAKYEVITPGKLIEEQLNTALAAPIQDKIIAKNTTNDVLLDSLVDLAASFIDRGLSSLVTKAIKPKANTGGNGSVLLGNNTSNQWFNTDQLAYIQLEDNASPGTISNMLQDAIDKTQKEINILTEYRFLIQGLPQNAMRLDQCLPGPDLNWETRLQEEYRKSSKLLEKAAEKDNKKSDEAQEAINRLQTFLAEQIQNTRLMLAGFNNENIPSAGVILDRIINVQRYGSSTKEATEQISKKLSVIGILKNIKETIESNPSRVVNGQIVENPNQNLTELKNRYRQIEQDISNDGTVEEANAKLDLLKQDNKNSFDKTNPNSLLSKCISERQTRPNLVGRDQGKVLFCKWQDESASGTTIPGEFNDPITTKYEGTTYTQDTLPFRPHSWLFGTIGNAIYATNISFRVDCQLYYRSSLIDYLQN